MDLEKLKQPLPYKWKVQTGKPGAKGGWCVAYIDARDAMDRLDEVCGQGGWVDKYEIVGGKLVAQVGIKINDEWIYKCDTGTESDMEAEKGQFSDAFKRACVKWGIGRFLYALDMKWVNFKEGTNRPVDASGKEIRDLTAHFEKAGGAGSGTPAPSPEPEGRMDEKTFNKLADQGLVDPFGDGKKQVCPVCQTRHNGQYPKCYDCYTKNKKV